MCFPFLAAPAAAAATGASGAAATAGLGISLGQLAAIGGTAMSVAGQIQQGQIAAKTAEMQVEQIEAQREDERYLYALQEQRSRDAFRAATARQRAQLAGRGVYLDSPTAVLLGENAAREMSLEAQTIRATGQARQSELAGTQALLQARGQQALINGNWSAAGTFLNDAPDLWPELLA